ncbi:hypothetical protein CPB84DRAFT_1749551 [Gymnopilus junonius]|uniref:Uncharacterized protein n=1 Tax=Gymnopilus junonius TaxID=109634 RepID=A0A9P5NJ45_GYMJU|nr:hypothetical protein CPB84DRAFT_1749551 [Gymnopilus junonius]
MRPPSLTGPRSLGTTFCARIVSIFLLLLFSSLDVARAAHNVTVDDTDTTIIDYEPPTSWDEAPPDPLDANGSHMVTVDSSATATFTFTGEEYFPLKFVEGEFDPRVAIYFFAPLFPTAITTAVSLDGADPFPIDLQDPNAVTVDRGRETALSSVVWSATGLDNIRHTLVVSVVQGESSAIVDSLVYTVPDPGDPGSSTSLSTPSATLTDPSSLSSSTSVLLPSASPSSNNLSTSQSPSAKRGLAIALGLVCTIFGLLVLTALYWYWRRRRRQKREEEYMRQYYSSSSSSSGGGGPGGPGGRGALSPGSSGMFSTSEMAETAASASASTFSTVTNLGAYNTPSRYQNGVSTPNRQVRSSSGGSRRVAPPVPAIVGVVGNGRARTASRRLGSSPLATHQPMTPTGDGTSLSTIPEMRMREREERESATASSLSGAGGEYKIGVVSPSTVLDANGSMSGNGQMPTPMTMPVPQPAEPPWSELGERGGTSENEAGVAEQNSGRKERWNRTFGDRMVKFS